ncbi:MAG: diacylglycerol kinase [Phycisphaerae bacterium]|nr:MAG: diacylglycerol kinase [Phycisphaerae bacterium]
MSRTFLAVVNRAAGGKRCGKQADAVIADLRSKGISIDVAETNARGHATEIVRAEYANGRTNFMAVGGDGTSYEILNGLFPEAIEGPKPRLALLPLGTGNSFLRDFSNDGAKYAIESLLTDRARACDVMRMRHDAGTIFYINLLSIGFAANAAAVTNRRFKRFGPAGYLAGVFVCLAKHERRSFPLQMDDAESVDDRKCLFLSFNNSKFTGGTMMIAPDADPTDGKIEYIRWGPIGRFGALGQLKRIYDGTHVKHPLAEVHRASKIDFDLDGPIDVMVDGEVIRIRCEALDVLPGALEVCV